MLKQDILKILEENRGTYLSGQQLADQAGVSRTAVWKVIKGLQKGQNLIDAIPNVGYKLRIDSNALSVEGIVAKLSTEYKDTSIELLASIDSTNSELKRRAELKADFVLLAEEQTAGRGRSGKSFFAPPLTSIYISFLLDPKKLQVKIPLITTAAAVAVSKSLFLVTGVETKIKWVNDIFYKDKKVVGILTESVISMENGEVESLILGIGVNCNWCGIKVPTDIADIATSLETTVPRNFIAAAIINEVFDTLYKDPKDILPYAREHSFLLGESIEYVAMDTKKCGIAEGLNDDGHLVVRFSDGSHETLTAGMVSVRRKNI